MKLAALLVAVLFMFGIPWLTGVCLGLTSASAAQIGVSAVIASLLVYLSIKPNAADR